MSNIKLECQEANYLCDKNQYKETNFLERVKLIIHLIYCKACRKYTKKNVKLTKLINNPKVETLENSQKECIKESLEKELINHQQ